MSDSLWPHGLQHTRPPSPSPTPGACSSSCPSSQWCHPTISSSVIPFSSCLQSFPASGSFPMSQFFTSVGQSIESSASASVLPINIEGWFSLCLTGLISLKSRGLSKVFSNTAVQKYQFFSTHLSLWSKFHIHIWLLEKPYIWLNGVSQQSNVGNIHFNMLSTLVIAFLTRSNCLLISWLQSLPAVILEPKKINCHCFHYSPIYLPWSGGCHNLSTFECRVLNQLFYSPLSPLSGGSLVPLHFLTEEWCHLHIWGYWHFS